MATDFQAVRGLGGAELRALLATGAPEERVWAAWAIALRSGVMPDIVEHVADEPSPGVRRALLPVLVGHGEVDILVALARHDPAIEVRRDAAGFVTRLCAQSAIPMTVVTELYAAAPSAVRCAILAAIPGTAPPALVDLIEHGSRSDDGDELVEAFDAALRTESSSLCERMMRWLRARPVAQRRAPWLRLLDDVDRLSALRRWIDDDLRDSAFEATDIPMTALEPLIRTDDRRAYESIRRYRGVHDLPVDILIAAVELDVSLEFARELSAQLREKPWLSFGRFARLKALAELIDRRLHVRDSQPPGPRHREDLKGAILLAQLCKQLHRLADADDDSDDTSDL